MRLIRILIPLLLCLYFSAAGQEKVLDKKVSVHYKDARLKDVLLGLESKYGVHFYYANNMVPLGVRVSVNRKNEPLSVVLQDVFRSTDIVVMEVGSRLVLKKDPARKNTNVLQKKKASVIPAEKLPDNTITASADTVTFIPAFTPGEVSSVPKVDENTFSQEEIIPISDTSRKASDIYIERRSRLQKKFMAKMDSLSKIGDLGSMEDLKVKFAASMGRLRAKVNAEAKKLKENSIPLFRERTDTSVTEVPLQFTFVTPVGTNGSHAGSITNNVSFNLIQGYAYGLDGVEFGGIANVEKATVKGVQFAGITNIAGGQMIGAQFAGITNINGKMVDGAQFAGIANVNGDSIIGYQAAGITNVNNGSFSGAQFSGIANVNNGSAAGFQAAGIANVNDGPSRGVQLAGIANVSRDEHHGVQVAGIVNRASRVRGSQIALINIADTVTGATLGLINIVKNGYNRFEIYGSEALYANIGFRFGTPKFHTQIAAGAQPSSKKGDFRLAYGAGFGSFLKVSERSGLTLDLMANHINEGYEEYTDVLNLLNQFKVTYSLKLASHLSLFAGPTFNVLVSQYSDKARNTYGSALPSYHFYNETFTEPDKPVNVKMWVGFNAGLRF